MDPAMLRVRAEELEKQNNELRQECKRLRELVLELEQHLSGAQQESEA